MMRNVFGDFEIWRFVSSNDMHLRVGLGGIGFIEG